MNMRIAAFGVLTTIVLSGCSANRSNLALYGIEYAKSDYATKKIFDKHTDHTNLDELSFSWMFYVVATDDAITLIDTGFNNRQTAASFKVTTLIDPLLMLSSLGVQPEDVTNIVVTHSHIDRIGYVYKFPKANIYIQEDALNKILSVDDAEHTNEIRSIFDNNDKVYTFDDTFDISDAMSIEHIGGHSDGSSVVWIQRAGKTYLIPGGECYVYKNCEEGVAVGITKNRNKNRKFVKRVSEQKNLVVLPMHDPSLMDKYQLVREGIVQIIP